MIAHDFVARPVALWALQFPSLRADAGAYVFPCDEQGNVPLHDLGRRALLDYLFARHMVGRTLARPRLLAVAQH
ncbi:hypothetical protein HLB44_32145 [Aquincola sp. S2]|uniref:Uncharacterized protein n=1 Tax=Pseudaquabacterium terrae TaxID=2732868 RepID=A0ABX2ET18_9BURK|nr:hypothetical protein [Aquabacterium terrae]NRF71650.1 hypothetical protein [Aquabacterium terrae]